LTVQFSYLRAAGNGIPGAARWKTGSCQPSRGWLVRPPWTPAKLQTKHQLRGALPASTNIKNTRLPFRGKFLPPPRTDPLPTKTTLFVRATSVPAERRPGQDQKMKVQTKTQNKRRETIFRTENGFDRPKSTKWLNRSRNTATLK
jgi:hypothetical protein